MMAQIFARRDQGSIEALKQKIEEEHGPISVDHGSAQHALDNKTSLAMEILIAAHWQKNGLQSVVMAHKLAASLMATDCPPGRLRMPWPCFEVRVPNNLVTVDGNDMVSIAAYEEPLKDQLYLLVLWERNESLLVFDLDTIAESTGFESFEELDPDNWGATDEQTKRALLLAKKLFVNTVLSIDAHRSAGAASDFRVRERTSKEGTSVHEFALGDPLRIDCVQDIRDFVAGRRSSEPKVSTMVRGHWRNQVHGAGRALRKLLWIQPFYRGHGPLVIRQTMLGQRADEGDGT